MSDEIKLITTADGSHSLLNTQLDETYHSRHGALQESEYVFIKQGLQHWLSQNQHATELNILEVGLGTGLNAWLTFRELPSIKIKYFAIEKFPLPKQIWQQLNYASTAPKLFETIHSVSWNQWEPITNTGLLYKSDSSLQEIQLPTMPFDLIYYDAFAPNKQPDMWTLTMLNKVISVMRSGGVFVTYCAKGQLKRDLKSLQLHVESIPGPPGKREMIRATKI